ncbi:MAG: hypothetical protein GWN87_17090, partial [Desulfuromonadales bacterium]|nr:hypothetical protein [Desulfuromonadales bacterium]
LPALVRAAGSTPPPFISVGLDGARYYTLLNAAMRPDEDEEMPQEMRDSMSAVFDAAADFYERLQVDVTFTKRGIEVDSDVTLAD